MEHFHVEFAKLINVRRLTAEIAEAIKSVKIPLYFNYSEYDDCVPKILEKRRDFEFDTQGIPHIHNLFSHS